MRRELFVEFGIEPMLVIRAPAKTLALRCAFGTWNYDRMITSVLFVLAVPAVGVFEVATQAPKRPRVGVEPL